MLHGTRTPYLSNAFKLRRSILLNLFAFLLLLGLALPLWAAQVTTPQTAVNFSPWVAVGAATGRTQTLVFTVPSGIVLGGVSALTMGAPNLDYTVVPAGTTCAALTTNTTCTVEVQFLPTAASLQQGAVDGLRTGAVVLTDSINNTLITVPLSGVGTAPLVGFGPGTIIAAAGTGATGYNGTNIAATSAYLTNPGGVAIDGAGNLYIADTGNQLVRRVTPSGTITTVAGGGSGCIGGDSVGDNCPATSAILSSPMGVAIDGAGNLYIADRNNQLIRKVAPVFNGTGWTLTGGTITAVAGTAGIGGYNGDGILATTAYLANPSGVAVDGAGNICIADRFGNRIREVFLNNGPAVQAKFIYTIAGGNGGGYTGDGFPAILAQLNSPNGVALDSAGNLYIADTGNNVIREVSGGIINTVAGDGTPGNLGDTGPAKFAQLNSPMGVAVDSAGDIYIADEVNNSIREVTPLGTINTVAGAGSGCAGQIDSVGDNCLATSAELNSPFGVALDSAGDIYIADEGSNRIREVQISQPPLLAFAGTLVSLASASQDVAVLNLGNAALTISQISTAANFSLGGSDTSCSTTSQVLVPAGSCVLGVEFNPTVGGNILGSVILTDNSLNVGSATQTVALQGTGIPPAPTTTTLFAAPPSVALGGTTALTASVSSAIAGTITGTVTFLKGSAVLGTAEVSGGLATLNVAVASVANGFTSGANTVTANYGGDVNFAASSGPTSLTVTGVAAATTTAVAFSANPVALGGAVDLTATVGSVTAGTITGSVTFMAGTKILETIALSGGTATLYGVPVLTSDGFIGGPNTITATYSGNANYQTSNNSASLTVTGVANPTTTTLAASPSSLMLGGTTTLTASVGSATPGTITGSVTFLMGTATLGTITLSGGLATLPNATVIAANGFYIGTDTVTAIYSGDPNYAGSTTPGSTPGSTPLTVVSPPVTTTTLTAAPASVILGGTTELVASVNSATSGTITGMVTFTAGPTTLGTAQVSGGWAKLTVTAIAANGLSVGIDTITASYSGSAGYAASTGSGTLTVLAATTTTLTPAPDVVTLSGTMELVATVTSTTAGTIAGNVTFMVNNTPLGTAAVTGGLATLPSVPVTAANGFSTGTNVISASYGGNATFGISTSSATVSVTGSAVTSTSLTAVPAVVTLAGTTELVASVTSTTTGIVTGSVTFSLGSTTLGAPVAVSGGLATLTIAVSAANGFLLGTNTITASYAGNSNYAASIASTTVSVTGTAVTATTLTAAPASVAPGGTTALTASVSSAVPGTLTGIVTFAMGSTTLGTAPVSGGLATLNAVVSTANGFGVGSDSITATYTGNANYASSSGSTTLAVSGPAVTTTSLTAAPASLTLGGTTMLELVAAVNSTASGTIAGTVTFAVGGTTLGTAALSAGFATLSHITVSAATGFIAGTDSITATYSGSSFYAPSTGSAPLTVLAATTTTLTAAPAWATFSGTTELVAAVSSTTGGSIAGNVTFSIGSTSLGTGTLSGGLATLNVTVSAGEFIAGANTITASYAGNAGYTASTSGTTLWVTGSAVTTTTLTAAPASVAPGGTTTLTAAVSSTTTGTITGSVTFSMGGITLGTAPVTGGLATLTNVAVSAANGFSVGSDTITASYGGNANYAISSGSTTLTVAGPAVTTTTLTAAPASLTLGGATELVASVSSTASGTIAGTVTFSIGSKTLGTAAIAGGWATLSNVPVNATNGFVAGTDMITASYGGGASFAASTGSTPLAALATTTTTLTAAPASVTMGDTTELVASVSSTTTGTITGSVTFLMGSTTLGTATISGGLATLSNVAVSAANGFSAGTDTIAASYGGGPSFAVSSGSTTLTAAAAPVVPSYTLSVSANTATIVGNKATVTLNLTSDNYAGTVNFNATSSATTLTASAPSVTLTSNGNGSTTLTIALTSSAAKHAPARPWKSGGAIMLCAVLLGAPFGLRRKRAIAVLLTALTISLAGLLLACGSGSGSGSSSTPSTTATPQTYTVTVTPTGTGTVTDPAPISITVTI